jgi:hypothetical protein
MAFCVTRELLPLCNRTREAGDTIAGPVGGVAGSVLGYAAYPRLAKPVVQALKNAADQGMFDHLLRGQQNALQALVRVGDNEGVMRS